jgi:uncharacterized protein YdgA (DUF945 family)
MAKRISLVLGSITLIVGCSYFLSGKLIQKSYYETIEKLNKQPNIKVNLLSYKRGFLHSNADLTVEIGSDNIADTQVIPLQQTITHGPLIMANTPNGNSLQFLAGQIKTTMGKVWQERMEQYTTSKQPLSIVTLVKFTNKASTWIKLTGIDQTTPNKFHVAWDPITGIIEHDLSFSNYQGTVNIPNLVMNKPDWEFKLTDVVLNLDASNNEAHYASNNTLNTKAISFSKHNHELIKLDDIIAKLAFFTQGNNLAFDLEATVADSMIINQRFKQDNFKIQANNINRNTLGHLPRVTALSPKATIDLMQQLTVDSTNLTLELPKHFTEAILSYVSFELYRTSYLGKLDKRPEYTVLQDISGSINKLVQGAVKQQLFLDKGDYYALNFDRSAQG